MAFDPQGHLLATVGHDSSVKLWNADSGECYQTLCGHTGILGAVAFSPDGKILASGRSDLTIRLWDVSTEECFHVLTGHTSGVTSVCFLPVDPARPIETQPQILVSGSHDETIRLWDIKTGECVRMFRPDRLYEGMNIIGITGLTEGSIATLKSLGAVEQ
ncbi:WD40 repeat domain-containing protein [Chamaesiphon polymorphus]|uniref:WD40 repeat domain-containing protein n=1 Tax=Chamaesiphon polymorphus TaxID=2107691 RepID=UPI001FE739F2|nr:hypothetical protein [Chamaesiphon polymorphus]